MPCPGLYSVKTVLKMCGLEGYANAMVGSLDAQLRKRTTIAVELAAKVIAIVYNNAQR